MRRERVRLWWYFTSARLRGCSPSTTKCLVASELVLRFEPADRLPGTKAANILGERNGTPRGLQAKGRSTVGRDSVRRKELDLRLLQGTSDQSLAFHSQNETMLKKGIDSQRGQNLPIANSKRRNSFRTGPILPYKHQTYSVSVFRTLSCPQHAIARGFAVPGRVSRWVGKPAT